MSIFCSRDLLAEDASVMDNVGNIEISRQGNFYIGGQEFKEGEETVLIDAMYVEFQVPAKVRHPYPIIFIHGGASTGAGFWSTPDGREGWATIFLRQGYSVYVVDLPTNGRSPFYEPADGHQIPPVHVDTLQQRITRPADYLLWPQARFANRFPGTGRPGDPAYQQLKARAQSSVETPDQTGEKGLAIRIRQDTIARNAIVALLDRVGPSILVTHSRSGALGWPVADARPSMVKGIVAVEPNGPPFYNVGAQPPEVPARPAGISYLPLNFFPPVRQPSEFGQLVKVPAQGAGFEGCWMPSNTHKLINLSKIPVVLIVGQASYHAAYDHCTARFLAEAGVSVSFVRLEENGITGNGHLMPIETNNGEIADLIMQWISKNAK